MGFLLYYIVMSEVKKFHKKELKKWKLAFRGISLAMREKRFWVAFVLTFLIFGVVLNLLNSGTAGVNLLFIGGIEGFFRTLWKSLLAVFGIGRNFSDFILTFGILLLQSLLIATIIIVMKHNRDDKIITADEAERAKTGWQNSGLIAGLAILGSGCPTCGTALITPVLGMLFSTGGYAIAGTVSWIITLLAIIVAIFSLRSAGIDAYAGILKVCPNIGGQRLKKNSPTSRTQDEKIID